MQANGPTPTAFSFESVLAACGRAAQWEPGLEVLREMDGLGFACKSLHSYSSLISACGKDGQCEKALEVLESLKATRTEELRLTDGTFCYNAAIGACSRAKLWAKALDLLDDMVASGPSPNHVSFSSVITACGKAGEMARALELLASMERDHHMKPDAVCYAAAISAVRAHAARRPRAPASPPAPRARAQHHTPPCPADAPCPCPVAVDKRSVTWEGRSGRACASYSSSSRQPSAHPPSCSPTWRRCSAPSPLAS